jgi:hypothetical protein
MKQTPVPFILCALALGAAAQTSFYTPPASPRARMNFDLNWKFIREDLAGAEAPAFDDSKAGDIFLNGKPVGLYENGVTAYGVDITDAVRFGPEENVLAVKVDTRAGGCKDLRQRTGCPA